MKTEEIVNIKQLRNYITAGRIPKIAVRKTTKQGSFDYNNTAGSLTKILKKEGILEVEDIGSYFDIIDNPYFEKEYEVVCRECGEKFKSFKDGSLTRHLRDVHEITPDSYLEKYPEESSNFSQHLKRIEREKFLESRTGNKIQCPLCGEYMKKISNTHIRVKHGMTNEEFKLQTGMTCLSSESTRDISRKYYYERNTDINTGFNKVSKEEKELREYIQTLTPGVDLNKRKYLDGHEIDIYLPDFKIGIEYNGLYYHSEANMGRTRNYHVEKTNIAEKNGIHLLQIFSDEWKNKKEIVKARLHQIILKDARPIHARKCEIREIDSTECNIFLKDNHIQGVTASELKYGAYYEGILVSVATFSQSRTGVGTFKKNLEVFELVRFCTKIGYIIPGLLSRFLKQLTKSRPVSSVYSYADRRWTTKLKNVYKTSGFQLLSETQPSYWYTRYFDVRHHRYGFAVHKLKEKGWWEEGKTEWEIMRERKFDRIWDCGNLKYEWRP